MAEQVVVKLVCDHCSKPAADSLTMRYGNKTLITDLCAKHLDDIVKAARSAKRTRRRVAVKRNPVTCPDCGQVIATPNGMGPHRRSKHPERIKRK